MKISRFFNSLYEQLLDLKEDNWLIAKAGTTPFIVLFTVVLLVVFFVLMAVLQTFWKP